MISNSIIPSIFIGWYFPSSLFCFEYHCERVDFVVFIVLPTVVIIIYFLKFYLFIYLFLAVLGLRSCARAFSSCGKWGPLFITVCRPLTIGASPVAEHRLQTRRLSNCGSRV